MWGQNLFMRGKFRIPVLVYVKRAIIFLQNHYGISDLQNYTVKKRLLTQPKAHFNSLTI